MNVDYILTRDYIKINGEKIFIGNTFDEIETKLKTSLFISQETDDSLIISEDDFQLHFKKNVFYMWTISPEKSFFILGSKKKKLTKINFNTFLKVLFNRRIKWEFNQELTFSEQICIKLENNVVFIFGFDKKNRKGYIGKVGWAK